MTAAGGAFRPNLYRALFTLALLPLILGITELLSWRVKGVGEARKDVVESAYLPVQLKPHFKGAVSGFEFETNRYGFRAEPDYPVMPEQAEKRLMLLGDSVGFGFGIAASAQFLRVAERRMIASYQDRRFRFINTAGQGYSPSGYYAFLKNQGLRFQPDLVVVQIEVNNDLTDEALLRWSPSTAGVDEPDPVRGGRYIVSWDGSLLGTAALGPYAHERTYTYTFLLRRALQTGYSWFPRGPIHETPGATYFHLGFDRFLLTDARIEGGWQKLAGALKVSQQLLNREGISFLVLVLPSRYMFQSNRPDQKEFSKRLYARTVKTVRDLGIPLLELSEELGRSGGESLYLDFAHLTEEGNRVVGERLGDYLTSEWATTF